MARARVERRRALARRRAAKAMAGTQSNRRADCTETDHREVVGRYERKPDSRSSGLERPSGRLRQQSGAAQTRLVEDEKKKRRAALTVQRVVRGWQDRRFVRDTMDWSLVREAGRRAGRRGVGAWGYERGNGGAADESELQSTGLGRATPLHSTGVGEESLEGLLQDLGL